VEFSLENYKINGVKLNYYYVCKRKLWLFDKGINFETTNDRVLQGKILHENSYSREKNKEVLIDDMIKLDILDKDYIKEIKTSSKMEKSDKMQLLYYLFYLKELGITKKGRLNYVKEKKTYDIELTPEYEKEIKEALVEIKKILTNDKPPMVKKASYCKKCSYYEFCFVREGDSDE